MAKGALDKKTNYKTTTGTNNTNSSSSYQILYNITMHCKLPHSNLIALRQMTNAQHLYTAQWLTPKKKREKKRKTTHRWKITHVLHYPIHHAQSNLTRCKYFDQYSTITPALMQHNNEYPFKRNLHSSFFTVATMHSIFFLFFKLSLCWYNSISSIKKSMSIFIYSNAGIV